MTDREHDIRERAYSRWQSEGQPDGRHEDHWRQAQEELDGEAAKNTGSSTADYTESPETALGPVKTDDSAKNGSSE